MGYEVSASQVNEYTKTGQVEFIDFLTETESSVLRHSEGNRDSFQKCPLTKKIVCNKSLGILLNELTLKRPVRLVMTKKVKAGDFCDLSAISIDEVYIGMFLSYEDGGVIFFNKDAIPEFENEGFVAIYGEARARYIKKDEDPDNSYLLKQGYASGDKLDTAKFPFVYK